MFIYIIYFSIRIFIYQDTNIIDLFIITGLPEFDLPPLDPLFFEFSTFVFDKGALHGVVNISNFIFTGLANTRFLAVRSHFGNKLFRLEIDLQVPKVEGSGACNAVGMLAEFRMGGKGKTIHFVHYFNHNALIYNYHIYIAIIIYAAGHINFTIEDFQVAGSITGHVANDILTVEHVHAVPSIKNIKLYFEDLFNGNKDLSECINLNILHTF